MSFFLWNIKQWNTENKSGRKTSPRLRGGKEPKRDVEWVPSSRSIGWWEEQNKGSGKKPLRQHWLVHKSVSYIPKRRLRSWVWSCGSTWRYSLSSLTSQVCKGQRGKGGLEAEREAREPSLAQGEQAPGSHGGTAPSSWKSSRAGRAFHCLVFSPVLQVGGEEESCMQMSISGQ